MQYTVLRVTFRYQAKFSYIVGIGHVGSMKHLLFRIFEILCDCILISNTCLKQDFDFDLKPLLM